MEEGVASEENRNAFEVRVVEEIEEIEEIEEMACVVCR